MPLPVVCLRIDAVIKEGNALTSDPSTAASLPAMPPSLVSALQVVACEESAAMISFSRLASNKPPDSESEPSEAFHCPACFGLLSVHLVEMKTLVRLGTIDDLS